MFKISEFSKIALVSVTLLHYDALVICLDNIQAQYFINGSWQNHNYKPGDIMIVSANEACPQTRIDREVALIELYLEPQILSVSGNQS